jgi:hypothetical protein
LVVCDAFIGFIVSPRAARSVERRKSPEATKFQMRFTTEERRARRRKTFARGRVRMTSLHQLFFYALQAIRSHARREEFVIGHLSVVNEEPISPPIWPIDK